MDAAGSQVEDECAQYAGLPGNVLVITQGGKLLCKKIMHLINSNDVRSQVFTVLEKCEQRKYRSVSFPAIGTGQAGQSPAKLADEMLDAIMEFANKTSLQHLKKIKIVIFWKNMFRDFYESMKKREGSNSSITGLWVSTFKIYVGGKTQLNEKKKPVGLEKKVDLAIFQICGESKKNVDETETWLKNLISKEQLENVISDELIENFDEKHIDALADLQRRKHVTIQLENKHPPHHIKITGISRDVCFVFVEVQKMIQKIKDAEEEQSKAELVYNLVEWRFPGSKGIFVAFDKLTNMQLEDAKIAKKTHLTVKINKSNYNVDLNTLQAHDDRGKTISIQRVAKNEGKL
ncbi:PAR14 polymerase, partial [Turnix velox]|nr:PAR14 polymerase [Turnix velox]